MRTDNLTTHLSGVHFIGGGNMAQAMIQGLLAHGMAPESIGVTEIVPAVKEALQQRFGVRLCPTVDLSAPLIVLAVKPQGMQPVVAELGLALQHAPATTAPVILSIAAGVTTAKLQQWLAFAAPIVRVMPNTPALIGAGIAGVFSPDRLSSARQAMVNALLEATGEVIWFDDEAALDSVTALSGSGPAYVFYFLEAMQTAGEALGLTPEVARTLAQSTFNGATQLAQQSNEDLATLRARVTSKGGTTEAALNHLQQQQVASHFQAAIAAAAQRSRQLGQA